MQKLKLFSVGLAIFAMLFGAGNVVFPLCLGRDMGNMVTFALGGFVITAVLVPLIGLVSAMLFEGDYKKFLGMTGRIPGALVAFICMVLIGPFGATPRCVTLSYAAIRWHLPQVSLFVFSLIAAVIIFACTLRKNSVVDLLGKFLGPIKLTLLLSIIAIGIFSPASPAVVDFSSWSSFLQGLKEGYWTMDLLGTIFFSGLIIAGIKRQLGKENPNVSAHEVAMIGLKAGIIGASLLGIVYTGFCVVAAMYGAQVFDVAKDQLLSALAVIILGPKAGILANATVAVACLTTAIALTAVFAEYVSKELFGGKLAYAHALLITVMMTFAMANLGFSGIARVIEPMVVLCYPALIALSLANAAHKIFGFRFVKAVTFVTFAVTLALNLI
jgi:LIVCS family branched-chain amino acid:cation transporter